MKKWVPEVVIFLLITFSVGLFWRGLFWPEPQLLVTPDFGRSDAWHFSFATKYYLAQNLKQNRIPLWSPELGSGFPLFAEGQIGTFFLPNLIAFKFLDPVTAYNLTLVFSLILLGWGTYAWLRVLGFPRLPSSFAGLTFAFSGPAITQLTHITLLEGMSFLPIIMAAVTVLAKRQSFRGIAILAILLSQQVLAGFPQASFLTILLAASFFIWITRNDPAKIKARLAFAGTLALSAGLSAVQLLPSWEFLKYSSTPQGFSPADAAYFSYPLKHLLTFLDPFRLGNPKLGTYPPFTEFSGSIFWENTGFIGLLPLISASLYFLIGRSQRLYFFLLAAGLVSFLLMLGGNSPLYLIYAFWPFNLFRVPSRFLWLFVMCLIAAAAAGLTIIWQKIKRSRILRIIFFAFLLASLSLEIQAWRSYHLLVSAKTWLSAPTTVADLAPGRTIVVGNEISANQIFLKKGWQEGAAYEFLRGAVAPDSNLLWQISSADVYAGRALRRQAIFQKLVKDEISADRKEATISALGIKLLRLSGVTNLITSLPLTQSGLVRIKEYRGGDQVLTLYQNPERLGEVYLASDLLAVTTVEQAATLFKGETFVPGGSVILPEKVNIKSQASATLALSRPSPTQTIVEVKNNSSPAVLVLNDTYYPGWQAKIDGKSVPILPANITFRAVQVPAGTHRLVFTFQPKSFWIGAAVSLVTLVILFIGVVFPRPAAGAHTRQIIVERGQGRERSRAKSGLHIN